MDDIGSEARFWGLFEVGNGLGVFEVLNEFMVEPKRLLYESAR